MKIYLGIVFLIILTSFPIMADEILINESFEPGKAQVWNEDKKGKSRCFIKEDYLLVENRESKVIAMTENIIPMKGDHDWLIRFDLEQDPHSERFYFVFSWGSNTEKYHAIHLMDETFAVAIYRNKKWDIVVEKTNTQAIRTEGTNHVQLIRTDGQISLILNDETLTQFEGKPFFGNYSGFGAGLMSTLRVDNFYVENREEPVKDKALKYQGDNRIKGDTQETIVIEDNYSDEYDQPLSYQGKMYYGITEILDQQKPKERFSEITMEFPRSRSFQADGTVRLVGSNSYEDSYQYCLIRVFKKNSPRGTGHEIYWARRDFDVQIWFKYGPGDYEVTVEKGQVTNNLNYEGKACFFGTFKRAVEYEVTNIRDEQDPYYYPTTSIPAAHPQITALVQKITAGAENDWQRLKAIHDWVVNYLEYDWEAYKKHLLKKTDLFYVLDTKTSVCAGYAAVTRGLLLAAGYKTRTASGLLKRGSHAWVEVLIDGEWLIIDTTWDDQKGGISDRYFLVPQNDPDHIAAKGELYYHGGPGTNPQY